MKSIISSKRVLFTLSVLLLLPVLYVAVETILSIEKEDTFTPVTISRPHLDKMLREEELKLVNLVYDDKIVYIKLRENALSKPEHQEQLSSAGWSTKSEMPHYQMRVSNSETFWDEFAQELNSTPAGRSVIYVNGNNPLTIRSNNKKKAIPFRILLIHLKNVYWEFGRLLWHGVMYLLVPALAILVLILLIRRLRKPASTPEPIILNQNGKGHGPTEKVLKSFPLKLSDRIAFIPVDEIACFYAQDNHVYLYDIEGKEHLVEYTLADLETKLPKQFIRVHRSSIVNSHLIQEVKKQPGSRFAIKLRDARSKEVLSGQSYASPVKQLFEI